MEYINKSTFNKLTIKEQVKVFNSLLKENENIKVTCEKIGISYSTVRDRFNKSKYSYNKYISQYEKIEANKTKNEELEKTIKEVIIKMNNENLQPTNLDQEDDVVIRSFRIRKNVLDDFIDYCENSMLKQYDVLSLFLVEGMEKYKKK